MDSYHFTTSVYLCRLSEPSQFTARDCLSVVEAIMTSRPVKLNVEMQTMTDKANFVHEGFFNYKHIRTSRKTLTRFICPQVVLMHCANLDENKRYFGLNPKLSKPL